MTGRGLELVEALDLRGDETVLDAGCGTGNVTARLLERCAHVIALDGSQQMLDAARERLGDERVTYVHADLGRPLPLAAPVDAIVSTSTLHWVVDHGALFAHLAAALRPGGALLAEYGGRGNLENVYRHVRALGREERNKRYAEPQETLAWLAAAGFEDARAELVPRPEAIPAGRLRDFLRTVTLSGAEYDDAFVDAVAARMDEPVLDYVRLRVSALRAGDPSTARP